MSKTQVLQGMDTVAYFRLLEKAATEKGQLIPYQTSLSFDPQRDVDTTKTKDGGVTTSSSLETEVEVEFVNNISKVSDEIYDALMDNKNVEVWIMHRKRKNSEGKYFAWYMQGTVSEDSNDNDADDNATRDVTFTITGTPKRGWLTLPSDTQAELDYVFRGLDTVTAAKNDGTDGQGKAYASSDAGMGSDSAVASSASAESH
jgi:TP901-1 family phage major tail protein